MKQTVCSSAELRQMLGAEEAAFRQLKRQQRDLAAQLRAVAGAISELAGTPAPRSRSKPTGRKMRSRSGAKTLREAIREVLTNAAKPMRAGEIAAALPAAGFKTSSADPASVVTATLHQCNEFQRVRRGLFRPKKR